MKIPSENAHNYVPDRFDPKVIAIVGGKGSMGYRLAQEFFQDGYEVRLTGEEPLNALGPTQSKDWKRAIRKWNENVCRDADVVVFSVPIPLLSEQNGLSKIFGHTPPRGWRDKLVIDICSTKAGPLQALSELKGASVIGTHPMFGPKLKSLAGQTVFVCPAAPPGGNHILKARLKIRLQWLKEFWEHRGVQVVEIAPDEHDSFMPSVQFGILLSVLLYAEGLRKSGVSLERVQQRGTPNSRVLCARLARMISPTMLSTYVNLAFDNPHNQMWLDDVASALEQMKNWMATGDRQSFFEFLQQLANHQPQSFRNYFTDVSVFLDECLAQREFLTTCLTKEAQIRHYLQQNASETTTIVRAA